MFSDVRTLVEDRIHILLHRINIELFLIILLQLYRLYMTLINKNIIINVEFLIIYKEKENFSDDCRQQCQAFNRIPSEYTSNSLIVGSPAENRAEILRNTPTEPYEYTNLLSIHSDNSVIYSDQLNEYRLFKEMS